MIEKIAGKRIHPAWVVPGGVNAPLSVEVRDEILAEIPEMKKIAKRAIEFFKKEMGKFNEEVRALANFPSLFLGLVNEKGELDHYDGKPRIVNEKGQIIADGLDPQKYAEYIGEHVEEHSYLKSPYYIPYGYEKGMYRVGPLARLNVCDKCGTPMADEEWAEFRSLERNAILSSFHYHYARLIEIIYGLEKIEEQIGRASCRERV